jgi:hypothetical protein
MEVKCKVVAVPKPRHEDVLGYWENGGTPPRILDLDTRWMWVFSFMPRPLYRQDKTTCAHLIGGWVGPIACLDAVVKIKNLIFAPIGKWTPTVQPILSLYTEWATAALTGEGKSLISAQIRTLFLRNTVLVSLLHKTARYISCNVEIVRHT